MTITTKENVPLVMKQLVDHDKRLREALTPIVSQFTFDESYRDRLLDMAVERFVISKDNEIRPLGLFAKPADFFSSQLQGLDPGTTPKQESVKREQRKRDLLGKLQYYAKNNDMKAYREAREEYSKL